MYGIFNTHHNPNNFRKRIKHRLRSKSNSLSKSPPKSKLSTLKRENSPPKVPNEQMAKKSKRAPSN